MDLPVIDTPIFPRWVWIEEITYSHIPIATLVTAFMVLAPIYEYVGYRRGDPRFDRLAKSLVWFSMILFSPGAALGTGIPMWLMGAYPEFWSRWSNLFFWPLIAQFGFFLLEVIFLFFAYYLAWDALQHRKRLHIFFGALAAISGLLVQLVWDATGAYMLTPNVALPGIDEPVAWSAAAFFNPSFPYLFTHRFFGNISYAMLLTGGVFALRYMATKKADEKPYFGFVSNLTFTVGFLAFFAMPFIGWGYARVIGGHAPVAFRAIMGGHTAPHFTVKMIVLVVMVVIASTYFFNRYRGKAALTLVSVGLLSLLAVFSWHPPLDWFPGGRREWKDIVTVAILGFVAFLWLSRGRFDLEKRGWRWAMFIAGLGATTAFLIGGFVRERSKSPDSVYGQIVKPEVTQAEADRFLFYDRCLGCHGTPDTLDAPTAESWQARIATERARDGVVLSEDEAARLVRYLEGAGR